MKLKFKKGDVVVVKKNTTCGFPTGTIARIESVRCDEDDYKSYRIELLDGSSSRYHDQKDLRKIKEETYQMPKFKVGDVVVVKENTTSGHPKGTIGRVVKLEERDETGQKACEIKPIFGAEHSWTLYHYYSDLRKVKGWDK